MHSYHSMKYLIELELITNDEKQNGVSDTPKIESQLPFKKSKTKEKNKQTPNK